MKQVLMFIALLCMCGTALAKEQDAHQSCQSQNCQLIFYEGFETGFGPLGWTCDNGLWESCEPSICPPPDSSRSGDSCAATVCCDNIAQTTSLVGTFIGIQLPPVDTGEFILASWWHCFWNRYSCNQFWVCKSSSVSFWVSENGGAWEPKWGPESGTNKDWHESPPIDLTPYAGSNVKFMFTFNPSFASTRGWYVDDIRVEVCGLGCYAGADKEICKGDVVEFLDTYVQYGVPPYSYSWSPCEGLSDCNVLYPEASPETTTTYILTVIDDSLNTATDTVVVFVDPCTDVPPDESLLPTQFALQQNYPNPFNPLTTISYTLPQKSHVTITVFNILEQEVRTLVDKTKAAGTHQVVWDGTDHSGKQAASGIYFYKFQAGDYIEAKKMLLLK